MPYTYLFDLFNNSDDSLVTGWTGISVTGLMLNVTGLPQATEYYYKIKQKYTSIYGTEIISAYSDRRDVATLNFNDAKTNLSGTTSAINYESFVFNFNRYPLPTYRITVAQDGLPLSNYTSVLVTGTTLSITGLTNNLQYDVSVNISYNALEEVETYTQTIPTISAPSSVATSGSPSATEFTAQWTNASGITQNLFYLSDDNFETYIINGDIIAGDSFAVTGLTESTSYKYALRSYLNGLYGIQESGLSSIVEVTTASAGSEPAIPTGVAVSGVTNTSGMVYWSSVDTATGYSGEYSANNFVTGTTFTTTGTSYSITGLAENTPYKVRIKAVNEFGESSYSSEIGFTTFIKMLAYISDKSGVRNYAYIVDTLTGNDRRISSQTSFAEEFCCLSPNGQKAIIARSDGTRRRLYIVDLITGSDSQISVANTKDHRNPFYHPTLNKVIFSRQIDASSEYGIFEIDLDSGLETFKFKSDNNNYSPMYSEDLLYIIFYREISTTTTISRYRISDADIINFDIGTSQCFNPFTLGNYVFWDSFVSGVRQTKRANIDNTGLTTLTSGAGTKTVPIFDLETSEIYFRYASGSDFQLWIKDNDVSNGSLFLDNTGNRSDYPQDLKLVKLS